MSRNLVANFFFSCDFKNTTRVVEQLRHVMFRHRNNITETPECSIWQQGENK